MEGQEGLFEMLWLEINKSFSGMHQCSILFDILEKNCTGVVQVGLGWYHMPDILLGSWC